MSILFRAALVAGAALVVAGCAGGVRLVYGQLDWLVPLYVEGYVGLDRAQSRSLKGHMAELLHWHCGTQLAGYAQDLRAINARFQNGEVTPGQLDFHYDEILEYWRAIREQAAPRVAALFASASDEQLAELFENFEKENAKLQAEHSERTESRQRREARKVLADRLEYWIGRLTPQQGEALEVWSRGLALNGAERLEFRVRWQAELRHALAHRADPARRAAEVEALLVRPERLWSDAYRAKRDHNRRLLLWLLSETGNGLTAKQRSELARRAHNWAESFEQLACAPAPVQAAITPVRATGAN